MLARSKGQGSWKPCIVDAAHKHCDIRQPAFWQTSHTLKVTETNGLGSETTNITVKLHKLRKKLRRHREPNLVLLFWASWTSSSGSGRRRARLPSFLLSEQASAGVSVKPDPPELVSVRQMEGFSTRLMVSWSFPSSWPQDHGFPLMFHIRYRPLGSMFWSEVSKQEVPVLIAQLSAAC